MNQLKVSFDAKASFDASLEKIEQFKNEFGTVIYRHVFTGTPPPKNPALPKPKKAPKKAPWNPPVAKRQKKRK